MVRSYWLLLILFAGFCCTRLFWFAPDGSADLFPYYDIIDPKTGENVGIYYKTYWHYIGQWLFILSFWIFCWLQKNWSYEGRWLFWLTVGSIIDYCLRYGQDFFNLFGYGVNYTDFYQLIFFILCVRRIKIELWKQNQSQQ